VAEIVWQDLCDRNYVMQRYKEKRNLASQRLQTGGFFCFFNILVSDGKVENNAEHHSCHPFFPAIGYRLHL